MIAVFLALALALMTAACPPATPTSGAPGYGGTAPGLPAPTATPTPPAASDTAGGPAKLQSQQSM